MKIAKETFDKRISYEANILDLSVAFKMAERRIQDMGCKVWIGEQIRKYNRLLTA